ncbi:hypothetical protein [Sphingobacterium multivorum]|uniref:hypothetical protein n=1 Tax=Sphingobacterium multivorum TaxID=28454 RepID=UPI0028A7E958|nr:hypothetical protein [Sphingobacterium multivorum]
MQLNREQIPAILARYNDNIFNGQLSQENLSTLIDEACNRLLAETYIALYEDRYAFFPAFYRYRRWWRKIIEISAGFIYVEDNLNAIDGFIFGVQILLNDSSDVDEGDIRLRDIGAPIIIRKATYRNHNVPNPPNGVGTCWIRPRDPNSHWRYGILTCEHNIGHIQSGKPILLKQLGLGNSINGIAGSVGRPCIDAAIIEIDSKDWPRGLSKMSVSNPIKAGTAIQLCLPSGNVSGTVLRVSRDPFYFGSSIGHRCFIDCHGTPGDSGSLIKDNVDLGALYMGEVGYQSNHVEGMCQNMEQIASYFDVDFYL